MSASATSTLGHFAMSERRWTCQHPRPQLSGILRSMSSSLCRTLLCRGICACGEFLVSVAMTTFLVAQTEAQTPELPFRLPFATCKYLRICEYRNLTFIFSPLLLSKWPIPAFKHSGKLGSRLTLLFPLFPPSYFGKRQRKFRKFALSSSCSQNTSWLYSLSHLEQEPREY